MNINLYFSPIRQFKISILKWIFFFAIGAFSTLIKPCIANPSTLPENSRIDSLKHTLIKKLSNEDKIKTLFALSKAYYDESELDKALETENQLLEIISKHGTKADSAKCFRLIGLVYLKKAWYDKSLAYFMHAQQLFGDSGDSAMQAKSLMNIGIVHDCMNNLPMSLSYYNKALDYYKRHNLESGIADCELNIAIILSRQEKYEKACENLLQAANIYKKTGNESYMAAAYINLGLTYKKMKKYTLAVEYLEKAYSIWTKQDDQYHICYYHLNMGQIMLDMKKTESARDHLLMAETLAIKIDAKDLQARAYEFLSDYNAARNNFALAYAFLNKSKQINDSILNAETTEKVNQIQYQYEIARREADNEHLVKQNLDKELQLSKKNQSLFILYCLIVLIGLLVGLLMIRYRIKRRANILLEEKNKLIEKQKDDLINVNASKDKFFSILAHDIKNPLSSIYGISEILANEYDTLTAEEKRVFTKDIHTLSVNLFEIINTLLTWSTTQSGMIAFRPIAFDIAELCKKSAHNLEIVAKQKDISLIIKTEEKLHVLADENMILSVLYNLITNAIKFAYQGSEIHISSQQADGYAEISVSDTGIGLSEYSLSKLFCYDQHFQCKGTAGESGTGLGLILCKDFVEKNGGKIRVESTVNKGSTFSFTLPVVPQNVPASD